MATLTLTRPLDLAHIDFSEYTGGHAKAVSSTEVDLTNHKYTAQMFGSENFYFGGGTVTSADAQFKGHDAFHIDGMNAAFDQLNTDRHDSGAVLNDLFGGDDLMTGSKGADGLTGLGGDDVLQGGKGEDTMIGGAGADRLEGGKGADHFTFTAAMDSVQPEMDLIKDLEATDVIDLSAFGIGTHDVHSSYDLDHDRTTFKVDTDHNGQADLTFAASGDHTADAHFVF